MTDAQESVVRLIVESDRGYVRLDDFPDALSFAVAELMDAGGLVRWCRANGDDSATLTAALAAELGIWLTGQPARWMPKGVFTEPPRARRGHLVTATDSGVNLDAYLAKPDDAGYPRPTVLLGQGVPWTSHPWEKEIPSAEKICTICGKYLGNGKISARPVEVLLELRPMELCLYCDRAPSDTKSRHVKRRQLG